MSKRTRVIIISVLVLSFIIAVIPSISLLGTEALWPLLGGLVGGGVLAGITFLLARNGNKEAALTTNPQAYGDLDSAIRRITELETETAQLKNDLRWRGVIAYLCFFCVLVAYMLPFILPQLLNSYQISISKFYISLGSLFILVMFTNAFIGLKMKHPGRKELKKGELRDVLITLLIPFAVMGIAVALTLYFGQS